jgi:zeta-carotene isomerase
MIGTIFPLVHSGLASIRPAAEPIVGARAWRVFFACSSLPLAWTWIMYFIAHRYDGGELYNLHGLPAVHVAVGALSVLSFFFLYPSTFNLLEVAAVDKPKLHLWETGVIRISRHPQLVGQVVWSAAHLLWLGTPFTIETMGLLVGHHVFAAWNGDRRLAAKHGEAFEFVKARTSIVPFAAIADGRQQLPDDYWTEWVRLPYAVIAVGCGGAYLAHPLMQGAAALVQNSGYAPGGLLG